MTKMMKVAGVLISLMLLFTGGCSNISGEDFQTGMDTASDQNSTIEEEVELSDANDVGEENPPTDKKTKPVMEKDTAGSNAASEADGNRNSEKVDDKEQRGYTIEQATSDRGQLNTIAFSGLAFLTGTLGADSFFPPGKVADFFGFQYMRDNDQNGLGHNTTFLTIAATNVLHVLNDEQRAKLVALATEQEKLFEEFALGRFTMMASFRDYMEGNVPEGECLSKEMVTHYSASLYEIDATLSYERAQVMGEIISSFTEEQKAYFDNLDFYDSSTWPVIENGEDIIDKKSLTHTQHVAVMTYASELFSWYLGNIDADAYFCPERHGTYFGGFYMKDYHAMGNPDYYISTTVTGDSGEAFLDILRDEQKVLITDIIDAQRDNLDRIVEIRYAVSEELRKAIGGQEADQEKVFDLIKEYGYLEGEMSYMYANAFAKVKSTLSEEQMEQLYTLRNLDIYPEGAFLFSEPIEMPTINDSERLFE